MTIGPLGSVLTDVVRRQRRPSAVGAVASTTHQACEALVPLAIGLAVQYGVNGDAPVAALLAAAGILVLFAVLALGGGVAYWVLAATVHREAHLLRVAGVRRALAVPDARAGRGTGELLTILTSDALAVAQVVRCAATAMSGAAGLVVTVAVLLFADPRLGVGVTCALPVVMVLMGRVNRRLQSTQAARQQAAGVTAALAGEYAGALRVLNGFGGAKEAGRRYRASSQESLRRDRAAASADALSTGAGLVLSGVLTSAVAVSAMWLTVRGDMQIAGFVAVVAMASFLADPVTRIGSSMQQLAVSRASSSRLAPLIERGLIAGGLIARGRPEAAAPAALPADPGSAASAVAVRAGCMLGVVTRDPRRASGAAVLAGRPDASGWLVAPHAVHLFGRSVREAMTIDRAVAEPVRRDALATVDLDDLPDDIGFSGRNLSGGQRQRLALARALTSPAPVLVLSDPLTAVDSVTETRIATRLAERCHRSGRSIVVITSSSPLLSACDEVVFLGEAGRTATGTHRDLLAIPTYAAAVRR